MSKSRKKQPNKKVPTRTQERNREKAVAVANEVGANPDTVKMRKSPKKEAARQLAKKKIGKTPNSRDKKPPSKRIAHSRKERLNYPLTKLDRRGLKVPPLPRTLNELRMGNLTPEEALIMAKWWKVPADFRADPVRVSKLMLHVSKGSWLVDTAVLSGVSERMFVTWRAEGHDLESEGYDDTLAARFLRELDVAEAHVKNRGMVVIQSHGVKDWRATAWWLEKRFPKQFANNPTETSVPLGAGDVGPDILSDDKVESILRRLYGVKEAEKA